MSAYNAEKYISQAIESILHQTFKDFELLIINDASTDKTRAIAEHYAQQDKRIKLFDNPKNLGLTRTLNKAIDLTGGQYIARMDADDIAMPERLAKQVQLLDANPNIGFCGTWIEFIDSDGMPLGETLSMSLTSEEIYARLFFHNCFIHSSIMMRRSCALEKYNENFVICQDYEFWSRLSENFVCYLIPEFLVQYRIYQQSMMNASPDQTAAEVRQIVKGKLQKIGIEPTEEEISLHLGIGHQQLNPSSTFVENSYYWLLKFWNAYRQYHCHRPALCKAMKRTLIRFWKAILTQADVDKATVRKYSFSALSHQLLDPTSMGKLWLKSFL
ncbi:MAG: glycosyltransferase [Bernardetiaceae bacterium]|nr:glycosyltransferase [Bernardetiaceae bacterium]